MHRAAARSTNKAPTICAVARPASGRREVADLTPPVLASRRPNIGRTATCRKACSSWVCWAHPPWPLRRSQPPPTPRTRSRWKMQSAFGSALTHLGPSGVRFSKDIERMSGGKFEVKFFEPGALIPPLECFDAVSKGSIESCWTTPGYHTGKYPRSPSSPPCRSARASASSWRGSGSAAATSCVTRSTPSTISLPSTASASAPRPQAGSARRSSRSMS